jgi:hypothetical protein
MSESKEYVEFEAPCCNSIRTCRDTAHYVISVSKQKILKRINAVRCYRGYSVKYKFYPSSDVVLVYHYVSNRGVNYLRILWKPENVSEAHAVEVARRALGLTREVKLVVEGEEVKEVVE